MNIYLVLAYMAAWLLVAGYIGGLLCKITKLQKSLEELEDKGAS